MSLTKILSRNSREVLKASTVFFFVFFYRGTFAQQGEASKLFKELDRSSLARGFYEIAPRIHKVELRHGDLPFIEVFVTGEVPEVGCYEKKEYLVEPLATHTNHRPL